MSSVLKKLGYEKVDVLGYSLGAGVAFQLAIRHPQACRRLALASAVFLATASILRCCRSRRQSAVPSRIRWKGTPMYTSYMEVAPHPEDFPEAAR